MDMGHGTACILPGHDYADAAFRRALGDSNDIDLIITEGTENASRYARRTAHAGPDDSDNGDIAHGPDAVNVTTIQFSVEFSGEAVDYCFDSAARYGKTDGLFRGGLADEQDADRAAGHGTKGAGSDTRYANHTSAFDGDQTEILNGCDGFDGTISAVALSDDHGTRVVRIKGILDP